VDDSRFPDTIADVITGTDPVQFKGYDSSYPIEPSIREVCENAIIEWAHFGQPPTHSEYATTLPYLFFDGKSGHNWFREEWKK
jgi:hypothetical protein